MARNIVSVSHPFHLWNGQIKNLRSSRSFDSMGETWTKKNEKCSKRNEECSYQILDKHKVHRGPLRGKMLSFVTHYCIELSCVALYSLVCSSVVFDGLVDLLSVALWLFSWSLMEIHLVSFFAMCSLYFFTPFDIAIFWQDTYGLFHSLIEGLIKTSNYANEWNRGPVKV